MGLALTSGYSLDVNTPLPEPQSPSACISPHSSPLCNSLHPLIPHLHSPLSSCLGSNRSDLSQREQTCDDAETRGPGPLALNASMAFACSRPPGATINVKCNKRPVNKIEQCQSHSLIINCWSRSCHLCACVSRIKSKKSWISQTQTTLSKWL